MSNIDKLTGIWIDGLEGSKRALRQWRIPLCGPLDEGTYPALGHSADWCRKAGGATGESPGERLNLSKVETGDGWVAVSL